MEAGWELDKAIGQRLFDYRVESVSYGIEGRKYWYLRDPEGEIVSYDPCDRGGSGGYTEEGAWRDCPDFSTSMDCAWLVVERMRRHKQYSTLQLVAYAYNRTYATFVEHMGDKDDWCEANGEHATPFAICLAALEACPEGEDVWLPAELFAEESE